MAWERWIREMRVNIERKWVIIGFRRTVHQEGPYGEKCKLLGRVERNRN